MTLRRKHKRQDRLNLGIVGAASNGGAREPQLCDFVVRDRARRELWLLILQDLQDPPRSFYWTLFLFSTMCTQPPWGVSVVLGKNAGNESGTQRKEKMGVEVKCEMEFLSCHILKISCFMVATSLYLYCLVNTCVASISSCSVC